MIQPDLPYKVLKYLNKLAEEGILPVKYKKIGYIIYLKHKNHLIESSGKLSITSTFKEKYEVEILPVFNKYNCFIQKFQIQYLEQHYSIGDLDKLMQIAEEQPVGNTFEEILVNYFDATKYAKPDSGLAKAIKTVLNITEFIEEGKNQQFISILYPRQNTKYVILCENKNRLRKPRHDFIEFWYVGGKNIKQLQFVPKPVYPIFYLCDWDYDGLKTYLNIQKNYFSDIQIFIPLYYETLMVKQSDVKNHQSKWKNRDFVSSLNMSEKSIVESLLNTDSIIEEQRIELTMESLKHNQLI